MSKLSIKQIWKDTSNLYEEYHNEDKGYYARLFNEFFDGIDAYIVTSKPLPKLSWCVHDITIILNCYPSPIEPYFYSMFPMEEYSKELRNDAIIRKFTKLCFYIKENIQPYSPNLMV